MSDVAEGIGAAIEGTLTSRAVEPRRGEAGRSGEDASTCSNCGAPVSSSYCPQCGQKREVHRTLSAIGHDLIHGVLHLDGKLFRTLPLLTFKPGVLTRRYIEGERAKFVSPMAMFLFSVFAMFAVFQMIGVNAPSNLEFGDEQKAVLAESHETWLAERDRRKLILEGTAKGSPERKAAQAALDEAEVNLQELRSVSGLLIPEVADESDMAMRVTANEGGELRNIPLVAKLVDKWTANPSLMLYKLQANAYKFSWLLIPLSIPFVWILFAWRRQFKAYDHAIFVTYSLAFTSLLFIVASVLFTIEPLIWLGGLLITFVPPIHLYKQLRHTYSLSRFSAFWRLMVLSAFIWIVVGLFLQALLLLGAF